MGGQGFPHFVVTDDEGTVLNDFYPQSLSDFEKARDDASKLEYLKSKAAYRANPESSALREKFFSQALELLPGEVVLKEALALEEEGKFSKEISKKIKGKLTLTKIGEVFEEIETHFKGSQPSQAEALGFLGPKFYKLYQEGYIPEEKMDNMVINYWYCLAFQAEKQPDIPAFETAYTTLTRIFKGNNNPQAAALLNDLKSRLETLKK